MHLGVYVDISTRFYTTILTQSISVADDVLLQGVKNITDLMVMPGLINLDFADVQSVCRIHNLLNCIE